MTNLAEFLLARIAEDEAVANGAVSGPWEAGERCVWRTSPLAIEIDIITDGREGDGGCVDAPTAAHVALWHPNRVLAECEAKWQIIAVCMGDDPDQGELDPSFDDERVPALALRALALPYSDHPDFCEEWKL